MSIPSGPLTAQPIGAFGVEVVADFGRGLNADEEAHFRALFREYGLVLLRGQRLDWDRQAAILELLGPVLRQERGRTLDPESYLGRNALSFHSDLAFTPEPYRVISLQAVEVEDDRSSTFFVDGVTGWRGLPEPLKARVAGLQVRSVISMSDPAQSGDDIPQTVHPLVLPHPVTGEKLLYMSEQHTAEIVGLARNESEALLREIAGHLYAPGNLLEHRWRNGDVIYWDNVRLQHARREIPEGMRRRLQRVTGAAKTFAELCPAFTSNSRLTGSSAVATGDPWVNRWTEILRS